MSGPDEEKAIEVADDAAGTCQEEVAEQQETSDDKADGVPAVRKPARGDPRVKGPVPNVERRPI